MQGPLVTSVGGILGFSIGLYGENSGSGFPRGKRQRAPNNPAKSVQASALHKLEPKVTSGGRRVAR